MKIIHEYQSITILVQKIRNLPTDYEFKQSEQIKVVFEVLTFLHLVQKGNSSITYSSYLHIIIFL